MDRGGVVAAVFLDLKKAFDTVNHKFLVSKWSAFNFSSDTLNWIQSYLGMRQQQVRIQNHQSTTLDLSTGVPQGSILGPILFSHLPSVCPNTNLQMYADDTVIYVHGNSSTQAASKLTQSLCHVAAWLKHCCLQLNVTKTVCMFFSKSKTHTIPPDVYIWREKLQVVTEYKYIIPWHYNRFQALIQVPGEKGPW